MAQNNAFALEQSDLGTAEPFVFLSGSVITNGVTDQLVTGNTGHVSTLSAPFTYTTGYRDYVGAPGEFGVGTLTQIGTPLGDAHNVYANIIGTFDGTTTTGLACDKILPSGVNLSTDVSHGQVRQYLPGVYCINGGASIGTAGINFNASGTYVFKINGDFTTLTGSTVTFVGAAGGSDANAGNLFWASTGAADLGATSQFSGTVMTGSAAITTGANSNHANARFISESAITIGGGANTFSIPPSIVPDPDPVPVSESEECIYSDCIAPTTKFGFITNPNNLVSFSTIPSLIGQDAKDHKILNENGFRVVNDELNIDGYTVNVESYYKPTPLQTLNVGDQNTVTLKIFEERGPNHVRHAALCMGIPMDGRVTEQNSCIVLDIKFNGEQTVTVIDPNHLLQTGIANSVVEGKLLSVTFDFVTAESLQATKFATIVWDSNRNVAINYFNQGTAIIGASLNQPTYQILIEGNNGAQYKLTPTSDFTALDQNNALWKLDKTFQWVKYSNGMSIDAPSSTPNVLYRNYEGFYGLKQGQTDLAGDTFRSMFGNVMNPDFYSSGYDTKDNTYKSRANDQSLQDRIAQAKIRAQNYLENKN